MELALRRNDGPTPAVQNSLSAMDRPEEGISAAPVVASSAAQLTICMCTHNPRTELLYGKILPALQRQTVTGDRLLLLIVDNASDPPVDPAACRKAAGPRFDVRVSVEPKLGTLHARARLIAETSTPWVLFVDDDVEIAADYVETGLRIIADNPDIGCFGGKLELAEYLKPPSWIRPLLPFLAIRDVGDEPITRCTNEWGPWEPPAGGAFVSRRVLLRYLTRVRNDRNTHILGRKGLRTLVSGEDSLMMRGAFEEGLSVSYQPTLLVHHHLDDRRFRLRYLARLMYGYGRSSVALNRVFQADRAAVVVNKPTLKRRLRLLRGLWLVFRSDCRESLRYAACKLAFQIGYHLEKRSKPGDNR